MKYQWFITALHYTKTGFWSLYEMSYLFQNPTLSGTQTWKPYPFWHINYQKAYPILPSVLQPMAVPPPRGKLKLLGRLLWLLGGAGMGPFAKVNQVRRYGTVWSQSDVDFTAKCDHAKSIHLRSFHSCPGALTWHVTLNTVFSHWFIPHRQLFCTNRDTPCVLAHQYGEKLD